MRFSMRPGCRGLSGAGGVIPDPVRIAVAHPHTPLGRLLVERFRDWHQVVGLGPEDPGLGAPVQIGSVSDSAVLDRALAGCQVLLVPLPELPDELVAACERQRVGRIVLASEAARPHPAAVSFRYAPDVLLGHVAGAVESALYVGHGHYELHLEARRSLRAREELGWWTPGAG